MAVSSISRAFDYKIVQVSGAINYNKNSGNYHTTMTSADFTDAIADGYIPAALAGLYSGVQFYPCEMSLSNSGVYIGVTFRTGTPEGSGTLYTNAKVMMVKALS